MNFPSPLPILLRTHALQAREELAEGRGVGKVEAVGNLRDAQRGGLQQEGGLHQQHLVDVVDDGAARDLTDDAGEIDGGDVQLGGVERDVVVLQKVAGQQTDEADEDFLDTLGRLAVYDGALLGVLQVEQENGIEHTQHLAFINMVGMKIADNFAHLHEQMLCGICGQCLFRLMQLHDGQVGQMYEVVDGRCFDGDVLVGHQAETVEVARGGNDGNGESRGIGVQVVGMQRQFTTVVVNRHPPLVNYHKSEAGHEPVRQVGAQDALRVRLKAVHPIVPTLLGQVVAYKYRQIFIQRVHLGNLQFNDLQFAISVCRCKGTKKSSKSYRFRQILCRFGCGFNIIGKQSPSDLPADIDVVRFDFLGVTGVTCANAVEISAEVSGAGLNGVESASGVSGVSANGVEGADEDSEWVPTALKPPTRSAKWVPTA